MLRLLRTRIMTEPHLQPPTARINPAPLVMRVSCSIPKGLHPSAENPISISAWAEAADLKRQTLQSYLPDLRTKGWIRTAGEGNTARQYPTPEGIQAAQAFLQESR